MLSMEREINLNAVPELVAAAKKVGVPLDGHTAWTLLPG